MSERTDEELINLTAQDSGDPSPGRESGQSGIRVGAAECDITPPVGYEIQHYYRYSIGVHDPLFARCLYVEDDKGKSLAIITLDLLGAYYETCDELRSDIESQVGISCTLINASHPHSSAALGPRGYTEISNDTDSSWNDQTLDAILAIVREAKCGGFTAVRRPWALRRSSRTTLRHYGHRQRPPVSYLQRSISLTHRLQRVFLDNPA